MKCKLIRVHGSACPASQRHPCSGNRTASLTPIIYLTVDKRYNLLLSDNETMDQVNTEKRRPGLSRPAMKPVFLNDEN
jgi:hypothetical protein